MEHEHHDDDDDDDGPVEEGPLEDVDWMELSREMDEELLVYDDNNDGYISYPEFMRNHKKRIQDLNKAQ